MLLGSSFRRADWGAVGAGGGGGEVAVWGTSFFAERLLRDDRPVIEKCTVEVLVETLSACSSTASPSGWLAMGFEDGVGRIAEPMRLLAVGLTAAAHLAEVWLCAEHDVHQRQEFGSSFAAASIY